MTIGHLRDVVKAQPFKPFRLHMGDGRALDVPHPDFVAIHPSGRVAIVFGPRDQFEIVDVLLVTSIEVENGARRRRKP
jgi:hypothetical protein